MKVRFSAAALMVASLAFVTGCPFGPDLGLVTDGGFNGDDVISDGTYTGNSNGIFEIWNSGQLYSQNAGGNETSATFSNGAVLKDSGRVLEKGDVEHVDFGGFIVSREVTDVQIGDWSYEINYDVTAQWGDIPMAGWEYLAFGENDDGTVSMYDTLELTSLADYDGGAWTFHANSSGTLAPVATPGTDGGPLDGSGHLPGAPFDIPSGKPKGEESTQE